MPLPNRSLGRGDLLERPSKVHGSGTKGAWITPGNRCIQRPVDLENARTVTEPRELPAKPRRQRITGDSDQLAGRDIKKVGARLREVGHGGNPPAGLDPTSKGLKMGYERIGNLLGASARNRPAIAMPAGADQAGITAGGEVGQRLDRMPAKPGEERSGRGL